MQYKLLQEVAGRTLIVDIAIQREGARPVALQVGSAAKLVANCLPWHPAVLSVAPFQHTWLLWGLYRRHLLVSSALVSKV